VYHDSAETVVAAETVVTTTEAVIAIKEIIEMIEAGITLTVIATLERGLRTEAEVGMIVDTTVVMIGKGIDTGLAAAVLVAMTVLLFLLLLVLPTSLVEPTIEAMGMMTVELIDIMNRMCHVTLRMELGHRPLDMNLLLLPRIMVPVLVAQRHRPEIIMLLILMQSILMPIRDRDYLLFYSFTMLQLELFSQKMK
jgi:hypothetical protein